MQFFSKNNKKIKNLEKSFKIKDFFNIIIKFYQKN
jgi:hypothetical protein